MLFFYCAVFTDSSVSLDSPRVRSGPADTFAFVSQQKDEHLIQVLGKSKSYCFCFTIVIIIIIIVHTQVIKQRSTVSS